MEIKAVNVNTAYGEGLHWLRVAGVREDSRNGAVLVSPEPVLTVYHAPRERVLFSPLRDANPFFHLMEALWMLGGRDDVAWPQYFNSRFKDYSDDGVTTWGAYGRRWRSWFGYDQLTFIADELRRNPNTRRAVLAMWDGTDNCGNNVYEAKPADLMKAMAGGKDVPCNTHIYFDARGGKLNMTVLCRSNDVLWGCYGANVVHFSVLLEYMAAWTGYPVGAYRQFSNNFHLYTNVVPESRLYEYAENGLRHDEYANIDSCEPYPLVNTPIESWNADLKRFLATPAGAPLYTDPFFHQIAVPMYCAWHERKNKASTGLDWLKRMPPCDWQIAAMQWIIRREQRKLKKEAV